MRIPHIVLLLALGCGGTAPPGNSSDAGIEEEVVEPNLPTPKYFYACSTKINGYPYGSGEVCALNLADAKAQSCAPVASGCSATCIKHEQCN